MADYKLRMPDVGEGVVEAEIVAWHVAVGDKVEEDQDLLDVMTDKATVEIPAPVSGVIAARVGDVGDTIAVGTEILVISTDADAPAHADMESQTTSASPTPAAPPEPLPVAPPRPTANPSRGATVARTGKPLASPAVRARALELDIELATVPGSGPAGRITRQDLEDFVAAGGRIQARMTDSGSSALTKKPGVTETRVIGLRRKIAQNMDAAWAVPMITYVEEVDVTEVEALRKTLNSQRRDDQPKLTFLPFLATALVRALPEVPQANAHYDAEEGTLTQFDAAHIGVATATDNGLMVPVLRHAESLDLWEMAQEVVRLAEAARTGKASREELSGSSITITSLGAMGGLVTTPLLNVPETAIIGVNKMQERPVFDGAGRVVPRLFLNLSSSFDHRIVDGFDAARLMQRVRQLLESPATLFI